MRSSPPPSSSSPSDWRDREPGWGHDAAAVGRSVRRGWERAALTVLVAVFVSLIVVFWKAQQEPFSSRVVLRISESGFGDRRGVLGKGALRSWIWDAALSGDRLFKVIEEYELYPGAQALGQDAAITAMREDLDLEVFANYFLTSSGMSERLRTARVALTFHDSERERSQKVAMAVAQQVIDFEIERSRKNAAAAMKLADRLVERAERALAERERQITEKLFLLEAGAGRDPLEVEVQVRRLARSLEASRKLLQFVQDERDALDFAMSAQMRSVSEQIAIANLEPPAVPRLTRAEMLSCIGVVTFLLSLPLCALAVGAFDGRVRDIEDLRQLGVPVFGVLPAPDSPRRHE